MPPGVARSSAACRGRGPKAHATEQPNPDPHDPLIHGHSLAGGGPLQDGGLSRSISWIIIHDILAAAGFSTPWKISGGFFHTMENGINRVTRLHNFRPCPRLPSHRLRGMGGVIFQGSLARQKRGTTTYSCPKQQHDAGIDQPHQYRSRNGSDHPLQNNNHHPPERNAHIGENDARMKNRPVAMPLCIRRKRVLVTFALKSVGVARFARRP